MTRTTNARLAGFMFLFYIATAVAGTVLFDQATSGVGTAAKLASIAQHAPQARLTVVLMLLTIVDALVLAAALAMILYVLLRAVSRNLALLAAFMRVTFVAVYALTKLTREDT